MVINDSVIRGNSVTTSYGNGGEGGGIYNSGTLTVRDSILSSNSALQGGGTYNAYFTYAASDGIGIVSGTVTVLDSIFSGNSATDFGGGIANFGTLTVRDSTLLGNTAPLGGDLYNAGLVSLFDSIIGNRYNI